MTETPGRGVPVRLLLVEDSENDAMLLLRELRRGGYEPIHERVCTPEGMEWALEEAAARGEPYEVVISDYYMPRFRAPDALALLRGLGHDVPFIVVSGKIGEDAAVEIMKAGANDYLTKENMARLCPAIERELKEAGVRRERARAEEALARSEIRFRRLVEQAADAMFVHDLEGRLVDVNRRACESLGYDREELLGMTVSDVEVGHEPASLKGLWDEISSGAPLTLEGRHRRKDGTVFPVEMRVGVFEDGESPPGRQLVLALARDISGRKEAEEALRQSEERYRAVVDQAGEGIFLFDPRTKRVLEANPAFRAMFGYEEEEAKRLTLYDLVPQDTAGVDRNVERALQRGYLLVGERSYRRKDGTLVDVEVSGGMISYGGEELICSVVRDITERKRVEEAMREVREAERNRMARDLHDSILQDIVYALQEIQILQVTGHDGGDPALGDAADALRRSVEELRGAIFDLRLEETSKGSLVHSLEDLVDLNRRMARGAYEIELAVGEGVPPGLPEGRGWELVRIVQEALTNVRRHSGAGRVRVELGVEGGALYAEVHDDGRGFDPELSREGVGRYSMRQRALDLGGEIELQSRPGGGTRVLCRVPIARPT